MPKFERFQIESLKDYLYHSYIHDATIETTSYDREKKILTIKTFNSIYGEGLNLIFGEVKVVLSISGNNPGSRDTIISLTAEEDYSYLKNCTKVCGDSLFDSMYLLFQMFSGDELHIISENVSIENVE